LATPAAGALHVPELSNPKAPESNGGLDLADIRNSLRSLMWRQVGVERSGSGLAEALDTVEGWCRYVLPLQFPDPEGWQLQNMLEVARLMIRAALVREETRGVHVRSDFPQRAERWRGHIAWRRGREEPIIEPYDVADEAARAVAAAARGLPAAAALGKN
ncbi:hypothetical protein EBR56_06155, partial [bacterium]|nr:hypothetical protein [bacterium]